MLMPLLLSYNSRLLPKHQIYHIKMRSNYTNFQGTARPILTFINKIPRSIDLNKKNIFYGARGREKFGTSAVAHDLIAMLPKTMVSSSVFGRLGLLVGLDSKFSDSSRVRFFFWSQLESPPEVPCCRIRTYVSRCLV